MARPEGGACRRQLAPGGHSRQGEPKGQSAALDLIARAPERVPPSEVLRSEATKDPGKRKTGLGVVLLAGWHVSNATCGFALRAEARVRWRSYRPRRADALFARKRGFAAGRTGQRTNTVTRLGMIWISTGSTPPGSPSSW